jgi:imidazolonepropionase-like amidohydrolase
MAADLLIRDVTIVDVEAGELVPHRDLSVSERTITAIGPVAPAADSGPPRDAVVLDGRDRYLIPGLIDCHVHIAFNGFLGIESDFRRTLKQLLIHGVTTAVDFFTAGGNFPGSSAHTVRDDVNSGRIRGPWLLTSYGCINAPGGFCSCSVGEAAAEVVTMEDVHRHLDRICATRPDFVKIVYDDVFGTLPNLTPELLAYLIKEVHARGFRAAVHIATVQDAVEAVACGADILGHGITGPIPEDVITRMAEAGTIVIPTLSSYQSRSLPRPEIALPAYSPPDSVAEYLRQVRSVYETKDQIDLYADAFIQAAETVVPLLAGGVAVVAGTDSGTWYTFPGDALHRELEIYVAQGVSPARALRMATADAARAFGLADRKGTLAEGHDATMVLLSGDPLTDIRATRRIEEVVIDGERLDLAQLRRDIVAPSDLPAKRLSDDICSPHHLRTPAAAGTSDPAAGERT